MGNIGQSFFSFFVGELVSLILAIIIKDEKKRIWVLVVGTILSGILALRFQEGMVIPKFDSFISIVKNTEILDPVAQDTPIGSIVVSTKTQMPVPIVMSTRTWTPAPNSLGTEIADIKHTQMVFVPNGEFKMGSDGNSDNRYSNEKPIHTVYLDAFWIDETEVTNKKYQSCVNAGGCLDHSISSYTRLNYYGNPEFDNYPVVYVSWGDAKNYCDWAGQRLPTEAEWEKAARGTDDRVYPWNDSINCGIANYKNACVGDTVEVGSYLDISPYGVYDMAGNVSEWVNDWYDWTGYYGLLSSLSNPFGPNSGDSRVVRGGSWNGAADQSRTTFRHGWYEHVASEDGGFRCALTP